MLIADFRKELEKRTIGLRGRQVLDQSDATSAEVMSVCVKTLLSRCPHHRLAGGDC
ncbi:hypothetical protein ACNKHN_17490 [Shigella flexneri]